MDRKEEIIYAALELGAEYGLRNVSMQQIADKIGIKKPSLYNHFKSKEELVAAMYAFLRDRAREKAAVQTETDMGEVLKKFTPIEVLKMSAAQYADMNRQDSELMMLYRVLYSERCFSPEAAAILAEESRRMVIATKNLFYAFQAHGLMSFGDIDRAAECFAFAIHGMMDYLMDRGISGKSCDNSMIDKYIEWFCEHFGGAEK